MAKQSKSSKEKRLDRLGILNNQIVNLAVGSGLTLPEIYIVLDCARDSVMDIFKQIIVRSKNGSNMEKDSL